MPPCRPTRIDRASPSDHLEQAGCTLSAADAHGDYHQLRTAAFAFDQCMSRQPRAAHAVRMTDRNRPAIDVQAFIGDSQFVAAVDHLNGEGFVQLPQVDIADFEPGALEKPRDREHRTDAHFVGLAAGDRKPSEYSHGLYVALLGKLRVHDDAGTAAIGKLAGVACRDDAAWERRTDFR